MNGMIDLIGSEVTEEQVQKFKEQWKQALENVTDSWFRWTRIENIKIENNVVSGTLIVEPIDYIHMTFTVDHKKCECGAEKCGSEIHSSWCPRHG